MTAIVETGAGVPTVLITTKTELSARSGGILHALGSGAIVRVDDCNIGCVAGLMVPPHRWRDVAEFLGIDPDALPEPRRSVCTVLPEAMEQS